MARRKKTRKTGRAAGTLVPRLRAAVDVVDEALGRLAEPAPAAPRSPRRHRRS